MLIALGSRMNQTPFQTPFNSCGDIVLSLSWVYVHRHIRQLEFFKTMTKPGLKQPLVICVGFSVKWVYSKATE